MAKQIPLTQGRFAIVDDEDYESLSRYKWHFQKEKNREDGYAIAGHRGPNNTRIKMHRFLINCEGLQVDHINGDKLDNRKSNLRAVTAQINSRNVASKPGSSSEYLGVYWHKHKKRWITSVRFEGKQKHLGYYSTDKEAHEVRIAFIKKHNIEGYRT